MKAWQAVVIHLSAAYVLADPAGKDTNIEAVNNISFFLGDDRAPELADDGEHYTKCQSH